MPIYEYQCQSCGERTEAIQSFDDPPLTVCPHCGGALRKLMSAPSFQFKGTGWYVTDYAGKEKSAGSGSSESESTGSESTSGGEGKKSGAAKAGSEASSSSGESRSGSGSSSAD